MTRPYGNNPVMKKLTSIEGCEVWTDGEKVVWIAKAAIDCDGSDNRHHDPCWQADTTLRHMGNPIDAEAVPYIVVPPAVRNGVAGVVMGCRAVVVHTLTGATCEAVVADIGPRRKIGELSCECARRIGLDGNPNHGGTDKPVVRYTIWPDVPAVVDGITYPLQPA